MERLYASSDEYGKLFVKAAACSGREVRLLKIGRGVIENRFCHLVDIRFPVVQAPIGGAATPRLAAAVSNAGGLGTLPLWGISQADLVHAIKQTQALTVCPFAVNLNVSFPYEDQINACGALGVKVISLFWGVERRQVDMARSTGAKVLVTVGSAAEARKAVELGADAIVAQGWEAGGHVWGEVSSFSLIPAVVDAVHPVPVVAAGGIADGRGLAAALCLGASAVWMGTRFLVAEEADTHPDYRAALFAANEDETVHLRDLFDVDWPGTTHRALKNSTWKAWKQAGSAAPGHRPNEGDIVARDQAGNAVVRYQSRSPTTDCSGEIEAMSMWAGQGVGLVKKVQPASEIIREVLTQAESLAYHFARH